MRADCILAIDQGTSATKCMLVDAHGQVVGQGAAELIETTPHPGWVEQDAQLIWESVQCAVDRCLDGQEVARVAGIGIANQRESVLIWDRNTGEPLSPVLNWRDNRTGPAVDAMRTPELEAEVFERSGLPLDSMFSASKARWLLDKYDSDRSRSSAAQIVVGTIDSFITSRFGGEPVIEVGNASRTQLLNVRSGKWDETLCELFGIPIAALPSIVRSTGPFPFVRGLAPLPDGLPVLAVMGDSHAALFAHGAFTPGLVKATFGTGSSIMGLVQGPDSLPSGLCLTIAWADDIVAYAAEGNIRSTGATLRWAAELLGLDTDELVALASRSDAGGVMIVPAFTGLGAPWWDRDAVGIITNLTVGSGRAEIARAALESIPQQITDLLEVMAPVAGGVDALLVDGGPTRNDNLMQLMADLAGRPIWRSDTTELSALGVAQLAGIRAEFWSKDDLARKTRRRDLFSPGGEAAWRNARREAWSAAVQRSRLAPHTQLQETPVADDRYGDLVAIASQNKGG